MDEKKMKIAFHETGHAVMAINYRQAVEKVSLREISSPSGTDQYLGSTKLEQFDNSSTITINEATRRIKIALGGYASEIVMLGGAGIGGDDLVSAIRWAEMMMQSEDFRKVADRLPAPKPETLKMISDPRVRAVIDYQFEACVAELHSLRPVIHLIAQKLYESEELTGDQVTGLFKSMVRLD